MNHTSFGLGEYLPPLAVDHVVAEAAEHDPVREIGRARIAFPPGDVVGFDVGDVLTARSAAAVALAEREALRSGEQPGGPSEVERDAVTAEDGGDEFGVGRHAAGRGSGDGLVETVDARVPESADERVEVDADDDRGLRERCEGLGAAERVAGERGERVGLDLRDRPSVIRDRGAIAVGGLASAQHVAHERLDRRLHRGGALGVEAGVQVHHAAAVFAHRQRTLHAELVFAGLDSVGVEPCLRLANSANERLERHLRCQFDERCFDDVDPARLGPRRRPVEHRGDRGCRLDADLRSLHGSCDVRMPRGEALAAEGLALRGDGADGDQPQRVGARCSGGRGDESRRVVESLRLRQSDIAELGPGSFRHLGGDPGENGVDVAPDLRERIGDLHEPGVAHLFHFDLRGATDSAPRRHRARPRLAQRRDIALERGAARAARAVRAPAAAMGAVPCFDPAPTH